MTAVAEDIDAAKRRAVREKGAARLRAFAQAELAEVDPIEVEIDEKKAARLELVAKLRKLDDELATLQAEHADHILLAARAEQLAAQWAAGQAPEVPAAQAIADALPVNDDLGGPAPYVDPRTPETVARIDAEPVTVPDAAPITPAHAEVMAPAPDYGALRGRAVVVYRHGHTPIGGVLTSYDREGIYLDDRPEVIRYGEIKDVQAVPDPAPLLDSKSPLTTLASPEAQPEPAPSPSTVSGGWRALRDRAAEKVGLARRDTDGTEQNGDDQ